MQNLFEHQAQQDRAAFREPASAAQVLRFIESAGLLELAMIATASQGRALALAATSDGKKYACMMEAADMLADVAIDLHGAVNAQEAPAHLPKCPCDACAATQSDIAHDQYQDKLLGRA
jgi:hypothetical protein